MAALSLSASLSRGPAFDEPAHITAGASYLAHGDYRFQPENGVLPQALIGLPLALSGEITPPPAAGEAWRTSNVWTASRSYIFDQQVPYSEVMLRARSMIFLLALALALVVWRVARSVWGPQGGLVSLALCALSPELLAHGSIATSDVGAALFFFLATVALWRVLNEPVWPWAIASATSLAGLALTKASAVLMGPVGVVLWLGRLRTKTLGPTRRVLPAITLVLVASIACLWAAYGGRFEAFNPADPDIARAEFNKPLEPMLEQSGALEPVLRVAMENRLLPEAWLYGFTFVLAHSHSRPAFLRGEVRSDGWWWYFPYVFLIKTPLSMLSLLVLGLFAALKYGRLHQLLPYVALLLVYWAFSLSSSLNIGARHLLPTLPPLFVLAGAGGLWLKNAGPGRWAMCALLAGLVIEVGAAHPRYLSYFNPLVGGSSNAWKHVVDSSLDWGQDGPALTEELQRVRRPGEPVWLAWFGSVDPRRFGVAAHPLPSFARWTPQGDPRPLRPGLYAVSATQLQGVYLPDPGPWGQTKEQEYQRAQTQWRRWLLSSGEPLARAELLVEREAMAWSDDLSRYEHLRFQKLCDWLKAKAEPVGRAGHSVLIYRLNDEDLRSALGFRAL